MASRAEQGACSKQAGLLSTVSRAALRGRTATLGAFSRSPNRTESSSSSPKPPSTGSSKAESRQHSLGSLAGISMTASSALRGLAAGVGVGGLGAGSGGGSGSATHSEVGVGSGRPAGELQSIRKGYLLMLRETGQSWSGDGGGAASGEVGGGGGGGARGEEWSERFFYLSGHFLRYKKQSRNLTSVNLKQTDHVEFNLQSAVVETFEEIQQREGAGGGEGGAAGAGAATAHPFPRRKHAFRLVAPAIAEDAPSSPPHPPNTSTSTSSMPGGGGGGGGNGGNSARISRASTLPGDATAAAAAAGAAAAEGGEARKGSWRTPVWSPGSCTSGATESGIGKAARQQVWVLAATNAKERAMWIQAIREAISLGEEFLCHGEPGCEAGSLAAMATRMSREIEVRDRHYRLRFYRSCFIGEDAVSWIQSDSECAPCSVEEALFVGNKMVAAGLIYHCTYGHSLENSRLFYKFADSVVAASHGSMSMSMSMSHQATGGKSGAKGSRLSRVSSAGSSTRPYGSASDLAGILGGGGGHNGGEDYRRRSFGSAGVGGLEYLEGDGGIDGLDDSSVSVVSSSYSVDDSGSAVCRVESDHVMEAGAEGGGGGGGSGSPYPKRGVAAAAGAGAAISSRQRRSGFREGSGDAAGEKKVSIRKMAREMEGLKLTCAEMERSQMRTEQQMQSFVTGLLACLETSMDQALACAAAALALAALSLSLQAFKLEALGQAMAAAAAGGEPGLGRFPEGEMWWAQRLLQVIVLLLVAFAVRSYATGREAVRRAIQSTTELCYSSDVMLAAGVAGAGLGQGRVGAGGSRAGERNGSGAAVPLLHASQVEELLRKALGAGNRTRNRAPPEATALREQAHRRRPSELLARMASNREPVIPPQLADSLDPLSPSCSSRPLPDLKSDAVMGRDGGGPDADARPMVSSASGGGCGGEVGAVSEGGGGAVEQEGGGGGGAAPAEVVGAGGVAGDPRGRGGVFAERPELASLPLIEDWPHHPIFVRLSPSVDGQVRLDGHAHNSSIPVNSEDVAVPFETPLFKGRLLVRVAGLPGDGAADYFRGKKRLMQCAVQGQFKKELPFDRAYTGQAYQRPFTQLPAKWLIRSAFSLIRRLSPALREDVTGDRPYMVSPLAATAQALRAEAPGDEAAIVGDLGEETGLLGASFMDSRVPASARKRFFNNTRNLQAYSFKPGVVYTFDFYQHLYNAVTFELDLGFRKVKLADYLNHQPAQIMALDFETGEMLWNVEIWNAALLKMSNGGQ
eukprot:g8658.t2